MGGLCFGGSLFLLSFVQIGGKNSIRRGKRKSPTTHHVTVCQHMPLFFVTIMVHVPVYQNVMLKKETRVLINMFDLSLFTSFADSLIITPVLSHKMGSTETFHQKAIISLHSIVSFSLIPPSTSFQSATFLSGIFHKRILPSSEPLKK